MRAFLSIVVLLGALGSAVADDYFAVRYPPSKKEGELPYGVTYTAWISPTTKVLRGVIVHQHGCGSGACKGGETAAYDLHWQALAKKWDCALLGPSYEQEDGQNCRLWCDPRNGSEKTFLQALQDLAEKSKHPELARVPWCLWGHSGGGFWASIMQALHPERIVAIWCRSGTAYASWEKGEVPAPKLTEAAYKIPVMLNPGAKENGDKRFNGAWTGSMAMFKAYRAKGAPIGFSPDPRTSHECGDSRYLAIPFFDACLQLRLPKPGGAKRNMNDIDLKTGFFAPLLGEEAVPHVKFAGKVEEASWLPTADFAKVWAEYVKTGATSDTTPPPTPTNVQAIRKPDGSVEVTWQADADFESGIKAFIVQRNGKDLAQYPEKPVGKFGRALFQSMSYHDTPERPLLETKYTDKTLKADDVAEYTIITVNSVGLKSAPSKAGLLGK